MNWINIVLLSVACCGIAVAIGHMLSLNGYERDDEE